MYERFTEKARRVMQLADLQAQQLNHEYIGTEHILLGLLAEGSGGAARVLKSLHVSLDTIRNEVRKILQSGSETGIAGKLPQTPRAKTVIKYSIEESRHLRRSSVGTEHLLLGLLREQEGVAAQVLMNLGLAIDDVRKGVLNAYGQAAEHDIRSAKSDVATRCDRDSSSSGEQCLACGAQTVRVLTNWRSWLSADDRTAMHEGRAIIGPGDGRHAPARVCLACSPLWREVHDLAHQDYEWQLAKEDAITEHDFNRAASIRDQQDKLRPRLTALLDRIFRPDA